MAATRPTDSTGSTDSTDLTSQPVEQDDNDENYVYMLDESRKFYTDEPPPFVLSEKFRGGVHDYEENGTTVRPIILQMDELKNLFGDLVTTPSSRLYLTPYDNRVA